MEKYYLAVDIGASGGRHILGSVKDGKIVLEEVYRFENGMTEIDGTLCWNTERIFSEILNGMKKCGEIRKIPTTMSIDTWGVDFVLLDESGKPLGKTVGYRDSRTDGMDDVVYRSISPEELYRRTGIQKAMYNTIYQLTAVREKQPELLEKAKALLMTPDYYQFLLTGVRMQEYTIASTSQLLEVQSGEWDTELIERLGLPKDIFLKPCQPGTAVGKLRPEIAEQVGFDTEVVLCPSHDTASAVLSVPALGENTLFISSGTWSLMGVELLTANSSDAARVANFANEGGYGKRYRFLKNIMGLWMIQSVRRELAPEIGYGELCAAASRESISSIVDCNDERFLAPRSMAKAVQDYCRETNQQVPETLPELACVIYNSLAMCYAKTVAQLEEITGVHYDSINIIGGGSNAEYLNELTAKFTHRTVLAGPSEATATGNILSQMIGAGEFNGIADARKCVIASFEVREYRA